MNMNLPVPRSIGRIEGGIEILWSDGARAAYAARRLREACPCATCRERRGQVTPPALLPVLAAEELTPLSIVGMKPVGQYAYAIEFSDGHDSGIYPLDYLRELAGA